MPFLSEYEVFRPGYLRGFVTQLAQPGRNWEVGLFQDDKLLGTCLADQRTDPASGWPAFTGFDFNLHPGALQPDEEVRIQVINTDHVIARLRRVDWEQGAASEGRRATGFVRHVLGLTSTGLPLTFTPVEVSTCTACRSPSASTGSSSRSKAAARPSGSSG
jgi:hypothetical protein